MNTRVQSLLLVTAVAMSLVTSFACANPNSPPGGPPDTDAPAIVKITPATGTIGVKPKVISFQFDEVVSETPKNSQDLRGLFFISPQSGDAEVNWRRSQLDLKPSRGWKSNTVYTISVSPGVMDLHGNAIDSTTRVVFSTGGPIPPTKVTGLVFDWQVGRVASRAIVQAIARDSTTYQTIGDSVGRFSLEHIPPGNWKLRAFVDRNTNRQLDPLEPWDTTSVTVTTNATAEFYAFSHDTIGLRVADVTIVDSLTTIRVTFDKPVATNQSFSSTQVVVQKVDSSKLDVRNVLSAPVRATFDSLRRRALADSIAKKQPPPDTSLLARTRRDSLARIRNRDSLALLERQRQEERRLLALRGGKVLPPRDTTPLPKMNRPTVYSDVYIVMEKPLEPNTPYRITIKDVRSLSGTARSPTRAFRTAPKETPKDSAKKTPVPVVKPPGNGKQ